MQWSPSPESWHFPRYLASMTLFDSNLLHVAVHGFSTKSNWHCKVQDAHHQPILIFSRRQPIRCHIVQHEVRHARQVAKLCNERVVMRHVVLVRHEEARFLQQAKPPIVFLWLHMDPSVRHHGDEAQHVGQAPKGSEPSPRRHDRQRQREQAEQGQGVREHHGERHHDPCRRMKVVELKSAGNRANDRVPLRAEVKGQVRQAGHSICPIIRSDIDHQSALPTQVTL
mmetsp:Transcript_6641/g.16558  ORF Transcript_6641/g.16558 Transcript_6641/m.16558 type:complete len:226 (+) Transcript_6641:195-872(+)